MFSEFMNDQITVKTRDGKMYKNIAASVQRNKIYTQRTDIPIQPGDQIIRKTPAGVDEVFIVEDPGFIAGMEDLPSTYQMRVHRAAAPSYSNANVKSPSAAETPFFAKALYLLDFIDKKTRGKEEPILLFNDAGFVKYKEIGLSEEDTIATYQYLLDKNLIKSYSLKGQPYPAMISSYGIDVIEKAKLHPSETVNYFPSTTYNYITIHNMSDSSIQQGGSHSIITQTVSYNAQNIDSLRQLVKVFENHIDDLGLDDSLKRKASVQVATINAQLEDDPDPAIVKKAGSTLRSITEKVIAGLIVAGVTNPALWSQVQAIMLKLF